MDVASADAGTGPSLAGEDGCGGLTDGQLLERYVAGRDDAAFQILVARHGSMVWRACRRVLLDPHEADDSFQVTFLVLARRSATLRDPEALGGWLRGVALRVAMRARRAATRRRGHEMRCAGLRPPSAAPERPWDDRGRIVREEVDRLRGAYRDSLELCYFRGLSHEEAAAELGWPVGTLKTRVLRGRRCLHERLARRRLFDVQ